MEAGFILLGLSIIFILVRRQSRVQFFSRFMIKNYLSYRLALVPNDAFKSIEQ